MSPLDRFWKWPDGWVWRVTRAMTKASRRKRFNIFIRELHPTTNDRVLDVGAGEGEGRAVNFFEEWYPWKKNITAVALDDLPLFRAAYPEVTLVIADGTKLPFQDRSFDTAFSNAVIEHVGTAEDQQRFLSELCRVSDRVFISTPNRWFPVDAHTMVPFAHWFSMKTRNAIYHALGRDYFASEKRLRLIGERELLSFVPAGFRARVIRQRAFGWTANLNVVIERENR